MPFISKQALDVAVRLDEELSRPGIVADIDRRLGTETDSKIKRNLSAVRDWRSTHYDIETPNEKIREKKLKEAKSKLIAAARSFEEEKGQAPQSWPILLNHFGKELSSTFQKNFNDNANAEPDYSDVFKALSGNKSKQIPASLQINHDLTKGDYRTLDAWLKTGASAKVSNLENFLQRFIEDNQGEIVDYIIKRDAVLRTTSEWAAEYRQQTIINFYLRGLIYDADRRETSYTFISKLTSHESESQRKWYQTLANRLGISLRQAVGLEGIEKNSAFDRHHYKKIREFISHEITNIPELNRTSAFCSLLFPEYKDFISFVRKYRAYDETTKTLGLDKIIDEKDMVFLDMDYSRLGHALTKGSPSNIFYLKCLPWITDFPVNQQGKLLTTAINGELVQAMNKVDALFPNEDLEKFRDLQIAREMLEARKIIADCQKAHENPARQKITSLIPEDIYIDGAEFGHADLEFANVNYDDRRYFHFGRLAKDICEHAGGHWSEPIRDSYINRTSVYCAIRTKAPSIIHGDQDILSYVWLRIDIQTGGICDAVFDGPEANIEKSGITLDTWYKIAGLFKEKYVDPDSRLSDVTFGPSQTWPELEANAKSTVEDEMQRGHIKAIRADQVATHEKIVDKWMEESDPATAALRPVNTSIARKMGHDEIKERFAAINTPPKDPSP